MWGIYCMGWFTNISIYLYIHYIYILKGYALCRRPLDTGGSCLPLCRKHEMNSKETRNWLKQTICMKVEIKEPTRKLAVWAVGWCLGFLPKASQTAPSPHQNSRALRDGPGPAGHGSHCLTLLSEPTRKLALWAVYSSRLTNVAFWIDKKTSSLTCLPA